MLIKNLPIYLKHEFWFIFLNIFEEIFPSNCFERPNKSYDINHEDIENFI